MNRKDLQDVIRGAYASYGRRDPGDAIVNAAVDAVPADAGEDFPTYVAEALSALDRLPANIGRWLSRTVYPLYEADRITAAGGDACGIPGCPECAGTGWHEVWHAGALPGTAATSIPCICNRIVNAWTFGKPRKYTRKALMDAGWTFDAPAPVGTPGTPISRARFDAKRATVVDLVHAFSGTRIIGEMHE